MELRAVLRLSVGKESARANDHLDAVEAANVVAVSTVD